MSDRHDSTLKNAPPLCDIIITCFPLTQNSKGLHKDIEILNCWSNILDASELEFDLLDKL